MISYDEINLLEHDEHFQTAQYPDYNELTKAYNQNFSPAYPFATAPGNNNINKMHEDRDIDREIDEAHPNIKKCIADNESYCFLIAWSILNYFIILIIAILLMTWYDVNKKSN